MFTDLSKRNQWLANSKHLRGHTDRITLSPDLPPPLRQCKTELLNQRKSLPAEKKRRSFIRQLAQWPYVELVVPDAAPIQHTFSKATILQGALKLDTNLGFNLRETDT